MYDLEISRQKLRDSLLKSLQWCPVWRDNFCSKTIIDYWQQNHYSLLFWWSIDIEISLLF